MPFLNALTKNLIDSKTPHNICVFSAQWRYPRVVRFAVCGSDFSLWRKNAFFSPRPEEGTWESEYDPLVNTVTCSGAMLAEGSTICPEPQLGCSFYSLMCLSKDVKITDLLSLDMFYYCKKQKEKQIQCIMIYID